MSESCGCAFTSSDGGLKSTGSSLLELCPASSPKSVAFTTSDRGGERSGFRVAAGVELEGESAADGDFGLELCPCATVPGKKPSNKIRSTLRIVPFYRAAYVDRNASRHRFAVS